MEANDEAQLGSVMVRRIQPDDWPVYREMSIEFVETCPTAILGNPAYMRAHPESVWKERVAVCSNNAAHAVFLAFQGGLPVGFATVKLFGEQQRAHLTHLWVQPAQQRRDLGTTLLRQALQFAQDGGCRNVMLWVTEDNDAATGLYERHGFRPSGNNRYLRGDHGPVQVELELLL
jgi:ribosomal protein S18 acetylase RimI-like enzyme